jgi:hypothetical protein
LEEIGFDLVLYFSHISDKSEHMRSRPLDDNHYSDYCHCLYSQNFYYWLFTGDNLSQCENKSVLFINDSLNSKLLTFLYDLHILNNKVYAMSFHFDNVCHYFTIITTDQLLIVFNTSQDHPAQLVIKIHQFNLGKSLLLNILMGYNKFYFEFFGFNYEHNIISEIESILYIEDNFQGFTKENLLHKISFINSNIRHDIDKQKFNKLISNFSLEIIIDNK